MLSVRGAPPYLWTAKMERLVQMRIAQSRSKCHLLKITSDLLVRAPQVWPKPTEKLLRVPVLSPSVTVDHATLQKDAGI